MTSRMTELRKAVEAYWTAAEARDWTAFADTLADSVVYELQQTRERVRGKEECAISDFWLEPYEPPAGREHLVERY